MRRITGREDGIANSSATGRKIVRMLFLAAYLLSGFAPVCCASQTQGTAPAQKPAQPPPKAKPEKKPAPKRLIVDLSGFEMLKPAQLHPQTSAVAATRGALAPIALAPKLGKFYGASAMFAWKYAGEDQKFFLKIADDRGKEIFRAELTGTSFVYPAEAPRLEPGKVYSWIVQVNSPSQLSPGSSPAEFVTVSDGERKEIEQELSAAENKDAYQSGLGRAKIFVEHRLWYDAVGAYTDLITRFPDQAEPYENRGMIYAQLKITQSLSEKDFARADELEAQTQ